MNKMIFELPAMEDILSSLDKIHKKLETLTNPNPSQGLWLNTKEAAKALGISLRTLQEKRNRSEIPYSHYGDIIRFRAEDIHQYLMDHYVSSTAFKNRDKHGRK